VPSRTNTSLWLGQVALSRGRHCRLADGCIKDVWGHRCAAGLRPVLDPPVGSRDLAAVRERSSSGPRGAWRTSATIERTYSDVRRQARLTAGQVTS
jgi:hypothetical protein